MSVCTWHGQDGGEGYRDFSKKVGMRVAMPRVIALIFEKVLGYPSKAGSERDIHVISRGLLSFLLPHNYKIQPISQLVDIEALL